MSQAIVIDIDTGLIPAIPADVRSKDWLGRYRPRFRPWSLRRKLAVHGSVIIVVKAASYISLALLTVPAAVDPRALIASNPRIPNLALVVERIPAWQFLVIGMLRQSLTDPSNYVLGTCAADLWNRLVLWLGRTLYPRTSLLPNPAPRPWLAAIIGRWRSSITWYARLRAAAFARERWTRLLRASEASTCLLLVIVFVRPIGEVMQVCGARKVSPWLVFPTAMAGTFCYLCLFLIAPAGCYTWINELQGFLVDACP